MSGISRVWSIAAEVGEQRVQRMQRMQMASVALSDSHACNTVQHYFALSCGAPASDVPEACSSLISPSASVRSLLGGDAAAFSTSCLPFFSCIHCFACALSSASSPRLSGTRLMKKSVMKNERPVSGTQK